MWNVQDTFELKEDMEQDHEDVIVRVGMDSNDIQAYRKGSLPLSHGMGSPEQGWDGMYRCMHPNAITAPVLLNGVQSHRLFEETSSILNQSYVECLRNADISSSGWRDDTRNEVYSWNRTMNKDQMKAKLRCLMRRVIEQRKIICEELCWMQPACRLFLCERMDEATTLNSVRAMFETVYRNAAELLRQVQGTKKACNIDILRTRPKQILREWLLANFLYPYPSDEERRALALRTGLDEGQVSTWFINARVRFWKPFIEELVRDA